MSSFFVINIILTGVSVGHINSCCLGTGICSMEKKLSPETNVIFYFGLFMIEITYIVIKVCLQIHLTFEV